MNHFELKGGELACEDVPLSAIAEAVGTPVYVYSTATLERHYKVLRDALIAEGVEDPLIAFAVKANSNVAVLRTLARLGAGADVVSEGEVRRALAAGVPPERIVFSGVGGFDVPGSYINTGTLSIGVSRVLMSGTSLDGSLIIGLSEDSPDLQLAFSMPFRGW